MRRHLITGLSLLIVAVLAGGFWVFAPTDKATGEESAADAGDATLVVYASPQCGCCDDWVAHMEENGFRTETRKVERINDIKKDAGLPRDLASCHTAFIDDYLIEGHVPADDVKRLLREKPDAAGLSVPRMPVGSPGMEMEGRGRDAFDVILFRKDGSQRIYESYPAQTSL